MCLWFNFMHWHMGGVSRRPKTSFFIRRKISPVFPRIDNYLKVTNLTPLLTWNFSNLLLTTTTLQSSLWPGEHLVAIMAVCNPLNMFIKKKKKKKKIIKAKKLYNSTLLSSNLTNPKKLWNTINKLLHRIAKPSFPSSFHLDSLPQSFATFFSDKIHKLRTSILSGTTTSSPHLPPAYKPPELSIFHPATIAEVSALLSSSPDTSCDLDPIPTSLLKQCKSVLLPTITNIINLSMSTGVFPDQFKNFCTSTSQKIQPWQRKLIQLQANISPILPIQTHRTTC